MGKLIKKEYHGQGYIYDDGDVPTCNFCGASADEDTIHSGDYSGEHICEGSSCAIEYMNQNILINPFEPKEVTITVCDRCDEEIDDGDEIHHLGGDDFCGHCIDYRKVED